MFLSPRFTGCLTLMLYFFIGDRFTTEAIDYCKISSCKPRRQTMCIYSNNKSSSKCNNYVPAPLTNKETLALIKKHNELRKKVADGKETRGSPGPQPPASDMKEMKWDAELARIAQRWADQCMSGHDECRNVERFRVGQNIANYWSTAPIDLAVEDLMDGWYNEVKIFSKNIVAKYRFGSGYGHYTQLVWGNSSYLGCGRVRFFDRSRKMNAVQLICNYGPAGNFINQPVYRKGKTASACPSGVSSKIPSLCN